VEDLPDQTAQPVGDGTDRLRVSEAWHDPTIYDGEDRSFGLYRRIGRLIKDAPHLAIAFGAAVTVVHTRAFLIAGQAPIQDARCLGEGNVAAVAPTSAMICCAE
jgi:hypothetical protein